jgi:hypothetical protein
MLSAPASTSATPPIKPDVRARLQDIEGRTGAKIDVRVMKHEKATFGDVRESGPAQGAQETGKPFPWATQSSNPPITSPPILSQPGVAISDSARSKSMYPFLPAHQMPQVAEHDGNGHQGEEIQRTDSPECIASPESVGALLPPDVSHPAVMESANPWNARSKTIDVPRPRIAGLRSPLSATPPSAAAPPGVVDGDAMLEELKHWGFAEDPVVEVVLEGREECARMARLLVLVLVDELVSFAPADVCGVLLIVVSLGGVIARCARYRSKDCECAGRT